MNIPQLDSCRFTSIAHIKERIESDTFQYKTVRIPGKVVDLVNDRGFLTIRQPDWQQNTTSYEKDLDFMVNTFLIRERTLEVGKVYEFMGEIEQVKSCGLFKIFYRMTLD